MSKSNPNGNCECCGSKDLPTQKLELDSEQKKYLQKDKMELCFLCANSVIGMWHSYGREPSNMDLARLIINTANLTRRRNP